MIPGRSEYGYKQGSITKSLSAGRLAMALLKKLRPAESRPLPPDSLSALICSFFSILVGFSFQFGFLYLQVSNLIIFATEEVGLHNF